MANVIIKIVFCLLLYGATTDNVDGAKILGIVHFPSKSHHILLSSLLKALAAKGHQVTMLSAFPLKTPLKNYEDIELKGVLDIAGGNIVQTILQTHNVSFFEKWSIMAAQIDKIDNTFFSHEAVQNLLASKRKFDLVIPIWFGNEAYLGLSHFLGTSTIAFSTIGSSFMNNKLTKNPSPYSYVPNLMPPFPDEMNFLQRVGNTLTSIGMELFDHISMLPNSERLLKKYLPEAPSIKELVSNVSLVLLNAHYSIESPRPYVPSMVQVGGLHLTQPKELEGELKQFMDSAVEGVVFFSLGSNIKSSELPNDKLKAIVDSFAKLPVKVLWKFETDDIPNLPKNVKVSKWLPQNDILAHPNLKLFVTHGGLLSTTEAIYHGVPMVGIPIFADQDGNVDDGVRKGYAVKVSFLDLTEATLTKAINNVLDNPTYRENVKRRSAILKDQPLKPIDTAVFWVEYVLRHNGAHHLKTSALKLEWYQYYLLDVLAFVLGIILTVIAGTLFVFCKLWSSVRGKLSKSNKTSVKVSSKGKKKKAKLA